MAISGGAKVASCTDTHRCELPVTLSSECSFGEMVAREMKTHAEFMSLPGGLNQLSNMLTVRQCAVFTSCVFNSHFFTGFAAYRGRKRHHVIGVDFSETETEIVHLLLYRQTDRLRDTFRHG